MPSSVLPPPCLSIPRSTFRAIWTVTVQFNDVVDPSSINTDTFTVRGQQYGVYPGIFSFPAPDVVEFDPTDFFLFGERIEVTVNSNVMSSGGAALAANYTVFLFEVETVSCTNLSFTNTQSLGVSRSRDLYLADLNGNGFRMPLRPLQQVRVYCIPMMERGRL